MIYIVICYSCPLSFSFIHSLYLLYSVSCKVFLSSLLIIPFLASSLIPCLSRASHDCISVMKLSISSVLFSAWTILSIISIAFLSQCSLSLSAGFINNFNLYDNSFNLSLSFLSAVTQNSSTALRSSAIYSFRAIVMVLIKVFLLDCFIVAEIFIVLTKAVSIPTIKVASNFNFSIEKITIVSPINDRIAITKSIFSIFFQRILFIFIQFIFQPYNLMLTSIYYSFTLISTILKVL